MSKLNHQSVSLILEALQDSDGERKEAKEIHSGLHVVPATTVPVTWINSGHQRNQTELMLFPPLKGVSQMLINWTGQLLHILYRWPMQKNLSLLSEWIQMTKPRKNIIQEWCLQQDPSKCITSTPVLFPCSASWGIFLYGHSAFIFFTDLLTALITPWKIS